MMAVEESVVEILLSQVILILEHVETTDVIPICHLAMVKSRQVQHIDWKVVIT